MDFPSVVSLSNNLNDRYYDCCEWLLFCAWHILSLGADSIMDFSTLDLLLNQVFSEKGVVERLHSICERSASSPPPERKQHATTLIHRSIPHISIHDTQCNKVETTCVECHHHHALSFLSALSLFHRNRGTIAAGVAVVVIRYQGELINHHIADAQLPPPKVVILPRSTAWFCIGCG